MLEGATCLTASCRTKWDIHSCLLNVSARSKALTSATSSYTAPLSTLSSCLCKGLQPEATRLAASCASRAASSARLTVSRATCALDLIAALIAFTCSLSDFALAENFFASFKALSNCFVLSRNTVTELFTIDPSLSLTNCSSVCMLTSNVPSVLSAAAAVPSLLHSFMYPFDSKPGSLVTASLNVLLTRSTTASILCSAPVTFSFDLSAVPSATAVRFTDSRIPTRAIPLFFSNPFTALLVFSVSRPSSSALLAAAHAPAAEARTSASFSAAAASAALHAPIALTTAALVLAPVETIFFTYFWMSSASVPADSSYFFASCTSDCTSRARASSEL
ncbi:hypothetical protein, conserved in T. vivax [Trypanosoma vivax Y486]|uniref:Uncharacterized protein n=1 Tax=Trypanosoma vivax (strain Y486) TaxID=1055687 RepID=F9WP12_TRYVY|nr:hypothetical protein, conserved in T. vivax [Trypanosoma vivax Y486]|eukprot:CCD19285.1 hypothetical protein, conserved in T. vivax [Trypanosoma vivax Y486]